MHIRCPHCQNAVEIVESHEDQTTKCPTCGSQLYLLAETATYRTAKAGSVDHFQLLEHVGQGHFGHVWKARDTILDCLAAIKVPRTAELDAAARQMFLREARAAAQLNHPGIVRVRQVVSSEDKIYIVSDFIQGTTLAELLQARRLPATSAVELCIQIGQALQHAHDHGVIHRDLKPQNVLMDATGKPHVTDFGLAKRDGGEITMTMEGTILGTPAYMSPEQARGDAHRADGRSDVWSLGVMLYEMLTGRRPFQGGKRLMLYEILHDDPKPLRKLDKRIPRDLETICLKALQRPPERRYQTAQEMVADLQRWLDGRPILARPVSRCERSWRWTRRNPALAAAATAACLLALMLAIVFGRLRYNQYKALRDVSLSTNPPGARVLFVPLDQDLGMPDFERATMAGVSPATARLHPGDYLVVAALDERRFHEVYRHVPDFKERVPDGHFPHRRWSPDPARWTLIGDPVALPEIDIPTADVATGMARIPGSAQFQLTAAIPAAEGATRPVRVRDFYLDPTEVTVKAYRAALEGWKPPKNCLSQVPPPNDPVSCVSFHEAVAYAESVGKRLPSEAEYEYAATAGGQRRLPWKDVSTAPADWPFGSAGAAWLDVVIWGDTAVYGLYSNVAEWTDTQFTVEPLAAAQLGPLPEWQRQTRIVRGGPLSVLTRSPVRAEWLLGPCQRPSAAPDTRQPGLGFRSARSVKPRLRAEDFEPVAGRNRPP